MSTLKPWEQTAENIRAACDAALHRFGVSFDIVGGHRTTRAEGREKPWECFAWTATFYRKGSNAAPGARAVSEQFEYYTGTGHVKAIKPMPTPPYTRGTLAYEQWARESLRPTVPTAADVLHCLVMDAGAARQSFADWCGDCGYDDDSISAFRTYQACCESGRKLARVFTREQILELEDITREL